MNTVFQPRVPANKDACISKVGQIYRVTAEGDAASARVVTARAAQVVGALWAINWFYGKVFGSSPLPDPIGALSDIVRIAGSNDDQAKKIVRMAGRAIGEVGNTFPAAGAISNLLLPDQIAGMPKEEFFGKTDLGQFGGQGAPVLGGIKGAIRDVTAVADSESPEEALGHLGSAASNFIPGGGQIKKTIGGFAAASQGGRLDNSGQLLYPVEGADAVRAILFGPSSTQAAQQYYDKADGSPGRAKRTRRTSRSRRSRRG